MRSAPMSNKRLLRLIKKYALTSSQVAELVRVQPVTVEHWRQTPGSTGYRVMPDGLLELLKIKLGELEVKHLNEYLGRPF